MKKAPFVGQIEQVVDILRLIHIDVCGPLNELVRGCYSYFITFTDDMSWYGYLYFMKYKVESFEKFKEFKAKVEKQTGKSIKALRYDRGGEYLSTEFMNLLRDNDNLSQWTSP